MAIKKEKPKIQVTENGPYEVLGNVPLKEEKIVNDAYGYPLKWKVTKKFTAEESYSLCRCGHSKNKPFCDHSHAEKHFDGTETASDVPFDKQAEKFEGPDLELQDARPFCVHARFCDRAGGIWELVEQSDEKSKKIAIEEAGNCPSGRLVINDKKTGKAIEPKFTPLISATSDADGIDGPLWVKGGIPVESVEGKVYEKRNRMTLCRCGMSENKPFCDGTHYQIEEDLINPIEELSIEHGLITLMLRVLEKMNEKIVGGQVEVKDMSKAIKFLGEFADQCHHGKEEDLLFPAMKINAIPEEIDLIEVLIAEHKQAREYIKGMAEATGFPKKFLDFGKKYIALLDQHIDKENQILFPSARQTLSQSQIEDLQVEFKNLEENKIGPQRHEEFRDIVRQLKEKYSQRIY